MLLVESICLSKLEKILAIGGMPMKPSLQMKIAADIIRERVPFMAFLNVYMTGKNNYRLVFLLEPEAMLTFGIAQWWAGRKLKQIIHPYYWATFDLRVDVSLKGCGCGC